MAQTISRRKLSLYAAAAIKDNGSDATILSELAAYLVNSGRTREANLVVRDIEYALIAQGIVLIDVTSARTLSDEARSEIEAMVKREYPRIAKVIIRESIDTSVIAGVKLQLPDKQLDGTIKAKLEKLKVA